MIGTDDEVSIDLLADDDTLDHIDCGLNKKGSETFSEQNGEEIRQSNSWTDNDKIPKPTLNFKSNVGDEKKEIIPAESSLSPQSSATVPNDEYYRATNTINQLSQSQQESCLMLSDYFTSQSQNNHQSVFSQLSQLEYEIPDDLLLEMNCKNNPKQDTKNDKPNSSAKGHLVPDVASDKESEPIADNQKHGQRKTLPADGHMAKMQYEFKRIVIHENGSLGMRIGSSPPPKDLIVEIVGLSKRNCIFDDIRYLGKRFICEPEAVPDGYPIVEKAMLVLGAIKNGVTTSKDGSSCIGFRNGIRSDDWLFLLERNSKQETILHLDYEAALSAAKHSRRPLALYIVRRRSTSNRNLKPIVIDTNDNCFAKSNNVMTIEQSPKSLDNISATACSSTTALSRGESNKEFDCTSNANRNGAGTTKTQFCVACQQSERIRRRQHHPWCERNPHFTSSGAKNVMERIHCGVAVRCVACLYESKNGRICKHHKHSQKCSQNRKSQPQHRLDQQRTNKSKTSHTKIVQREQKSGRSVKKQSNGERAISNRDQTDVVSSDDDTSGDENESIYQNEARGHIQLIVPKRRMEMKHDDRFIAPAVKNESKRHEFNGTAKHLRTTSATSKLLEKADWTRKDCVVIRHPPEQEHSEDDVDDASCFHDKLQVDWETCDNPWGATGHCDGDISLHCSNNDCLRQMEMITPIQEKRFAMFPFESVDGKQESRYINTHLSPDEGLLCIQLKRNVMATRHWGFSIQRHEFGGACLVTSVEDFSPAAAATHLGKGSLSHAPLCINDMILAINGKRVGGMTAFSFTLELEIGGPQLMLAVARYRFSNDTQNGVFTTQSATFKQLDAMTNDEYRLDWVDICTSAAATTTTNSQVENDQETTALNLNWYGADDYKPNSFGVEENTSKPTCYENSIPPVEYYNGNKCRDTDYRQKHKSNTDHSSDSESEDWKDKREKAPLLMHIVPESKTNKSHLNFVKSKSKDNQQNDESDSSSSSSDERDGNANLPCVCGALHKSGRYSFWIQCFECESWYKVNAKCIGFTRREAEYIEHWRCPGCATAVRSCVAVERTASVKECSQSIPICKASCREQFRQNENVRSKSKEMIDGEKVNQYTSPIKGDVHDNKLTIAIGTMKMQEKLEQQFLDKHTGPDSKQWSVPHKLNMFNATWPSRNIAEGPNDGDCTKRNDNGKDAKRNYDMISSNAPKNTFPQPRGRPMMGHIWDTEVGKWIRRPSKLIASTHAKVCGNGTGLCIEKISRSYSTKSDDECNLRCAVTRDVCIPEDGAVGHPKIAESSRLFLLGEIVYVKEHSWPGVNNPDGFCIILKSYEDENDDLLYDVRYIIDKRTKVGIFSKFISNSVEHGWKQT